MKVFVACMYPGYARSKIRYVYCFLADWPPAISISTTSSHPQVEDDDVICMVRTAMPDITINSQVRITCSQQAFISIAYQISSRVNFGEPMDAKFWGGEGGPNLGSNRLIPN